MKQRTLKKELEFEGVGVHFGLFSKIILKPALVNTGIVFKTPKFPDLKIEIGKVIPEIAMHASIIKNDNFAVSTLEHLMAAISSFFIDNLEIEISGIEVPILDGSALAFVDQFASVGILEQDEEKSFLTPKEIIKFEDKDGRILQVIPAQKLSTDKDGDKFDTNLYFDYFADFSHPLVGCARLSGTFSTDYFVKNIAAARTFGFLEQLPFLRKHGLAKGTTLGNTVVIGEEDFLNEKRFEDEFVRHKLLDLVGDLALLGKNLAGTIKAEKTGHSFNRLVVENYIKNPDKWILVK